MKHLIILLAICGLASGCAARQDKKTMTAAEEARYAAAIEQAEMENPSPIQPGDEIVVNMSGDPAAAQSVISAPESQTPAAPARSFEVSRAEYDSFFAQSPAVILARLELEPIMDGTSLLGYRIRSIKEPFDGVDIRANDIVIGIDGVMPRTPDDYFKRWETAKGASSCKVNIQRDVDRFDLVWNVK